MPRSFPPAPLEVEAVPYGADSVVAVSGEVDRASANRLRRALVDAASAPAARVAVDLEGVTFIDGGGVSVLLDADAALAERLVLFPPSPQVQRVFSRAHVSETFAVVARANLEYVRLLCETFAREGFDAVAELVPDDVEWVPWQAGCRVLRGSREARAFFARQAHEAAAPAPEPKDFSSVGDDVLVRFELPLDDGTVKLLWARYEFAGAKLRRAISFDHERDAVAFSCA